MFDKIKDLLTSSRHEKNSGEDTKDPLLKTKVAASVLLLETAYTDDYCSPEELNIIQSVLNKKFNITNELASEIMALAQRKLEEEVDLWQFSNLINQEFSEQEKITIMETAWQIIYTDGKLDSNEDNFAHTMAKLLHLSHEQMISAKLKAKNKMMN